MEDTARQTARSRPIRLRDAFALAILIGAAVIAADLIFRTSLLRAVWPLVVVPPDGAIITPPVLVRWEGPESMRATLTGSGYREDLGVRTNPFEIASEQFPRAGQYTVELEPAGFPWMGGAERRFLVRLPEDDRPVMGSPEDASSEDGELHEALQRLEAERDRATTESEALREENRRLEAQTRELSEQIDLLESEQLRTQTEQERAEMDQAQLLDQQQQLLQENRELRSRLEGIPPCITWGYLFYPRPQTVPPTQRYVVVSDSRGRVFQNQMECELVRRRNPAAVSPCVCVGTTF